MPELTRGKIHSCLKDSLKGFFSRIGFQRKKNGMYVKDSEDCRQIIDYGVKKSRGVFRIELGFRVRFPEVEHIQNPGEEDEYIGTYGGLAHINMGERYFDWICDDESQLDGIAAEIQDVIERGALPFFEKYCILDNIYANLTSDDGRKWLTYDPQSCVCALSAIDWLQGRKEQAMQRLDDYLAVNREKYPKDWVAAQRVKDYLLSL